MAEFGGAAADEAIPVSSGGSYHATPRPESLPRGSALFVRDWSSLLRTDRADHFARLYRSAGFAWISPVLEPGRAIWNEAIADALEAEGLPVHPTWILPRPDDWRARLPAFVRRCARFGARAPILDPEREWRGRTNEEARAFVAAVADHFPATMITSYGTPQAIRDFPWRGFLETTDDAFPQLYDRDLYFEGAPYFDRGRRGYEARGARRVDVAGSMWRHALPRGMKSPAELARHLLQIPETPARILWAPAPITADRWRVLDAWNHGRRAELEELARSARARRRGSSSSSSSSGSGAGLAVLIGLAGAAAIGASLLR